MKTVILMVLKSKTHNGWLVCISANDKEDGRVIIHNGEKLFHEHEGNLYSSPASVVPWAYEAASAWLPALQEKGFSQIVWAGELVSTPMTFDTFVAMGESDDDDDSDESDDGEPTNESRADAAQAAFDAWADHKGDCLDDSSFGDLLADLMHKAERDGINFVESLRMAYLNYSAESDNGFDMPISQDNSAGELIDARQSAIALQDKVNELQAAETNNISLMVVLTDGLFDYVVTDAPKTMQINISHVDLAMRGEAKQRYMPDDEKAEFARCLEWLNAGQRRMLI